MSGKVGMEVVRREKICKGKRRGQRKILRKFLWGCTGPQGKIMEEESGDTELRP